ncbi:hypothetical protein FQN57_002934 [Myotisia sp. PD_48]|nr:hypothetical protein FQN57_002934 [Myotisia sp. PD_48]
MMEMDKTLDGNDPVASVWKCLRNGYPLMTIFNATHPTEPLTLNENKVQERNRPKAAAFKFLQACLQELEFPQQECFLITDLYGDSTTGFVKARFSQDGPLVIKMVNRVLDILEVQGQLSKVSSSTTRSSPNEKVKLTQREHILKEMLETERDYVHHLQNLQSLKKELEETGALTGDSSHQIFLNLNNLLDFAQRFLIRMEQHNALPEEDQNWGELFLNHQEGFRQYEPFIANQFRCDDVCQKEWDKINSAPRSLDLQQMVAQQSTLNGFFVKPFQRLTKYPLMLMELRKQTDHEVLDADIAGAVDMVQLVLDRANNAIDKEHLATAVMELTTRVDDWKTLKVDGFGELLRFGTFTVLKGDGSKDTEREVCLTPIQQFASVLDLHLLFALPCMNPTQALVEPTIVHLDEDTMRKWYKDIDAQRAIQVDERSLRHTGTSETEFTYLKNAPKMQNPYQEEYIAEEESMRDNSAISEFSMSRNASSTSLRGRATTSGSAGPGSISGSRPRFPIAEPPLSVHTQFSAGTISPGERNGASYFSPIGEGPSSTRSSSQSTTCTYSRQGTPSNVWSDEPSRYTAPAMPRTGSRDGSNPNPYFNSNTRVAQRPSLPPLPSNQNHAGMQSQSRLRSASSPDIHNHNLSDPRRYMNGNHAIQNVDNVPVPPIPPHMANMRVPVNRSQSNSPTNNVQIRSTVQPSNLQHGPRHGQPPVGYNYESYTTPARDSRSQLPPTSNPSIQSPQSSQGNPFTNTGESATYMPSQLKAKINFDDNYVTLVIASNILFRSLTDRVDAKLARFTDRSIGGRSARLRYRDEDGDFVTIDSDEAVQVAFMEWCEQHQDLLASGQVGEIQLFCQPIES